MRLVPSDAEFMATELETSNTMSDSSGGFRFISVTLGQYTLKAVKQPPPVRNPRDMTATMVEVGGGMVFSTVTSSSPVDAPLPAGPTWWESMPISVGRRSTNISVGLRTGTRLGPRGIQARRAFQTRMHCRINITRAAGGRWRVGGLLRGRVEPHGQFTTVGLPGGRYVLRVIGGLPAPWLLKSAMHEGRDLADVAFDASGADLSGVIITLSDAPSELNGSVTGSDGTPDGDAAVLVFPTDNNGWAEWGMNPRRLRTLRTGATGSFSARGIPGGDYYVVAVPQEMAVDWQDPATLRSARASSTQVRIEEGRTKTQALRTIGNAR
jgi:hypothetical protein